MLEFVAIASLVFGLIALVFCCGSAGLFFMDDDDEAGVVAIISLVILVICVIVFAMTASSLEDPGLSSQDQSLIRTQLIQVHPEAQKTNWDTSNVVTYLDYSGDKAQYCTLRWDWDADRKLAIWQKPECADVAP